MTAGASSSEAAIGFVRVVDDEGWQAVRHIRQVVFVEEQACPPEEEWDEHDATARHLLGLVEGEPAACARWRVVRYDGAPAAKLERFAVLKDYRGKGYGRPLVLFAMEEARRAGHRRFVMNAQAHLQGFYESLGFEDDGERFTEAGIPHLRMRRFE
jgi:predicted GNAT family N-acyltransferase